MLLDFNIIVTVFKVPEGIAELSVYYKLASNKEFLIAWEVRYQQRLKYSVL